jgi:hypothetical protein
MVNALGESALRSVVLVHTMACRGMPDVYEPTRKRARALWRPSRANWPLWVVGRVVLFASPPTANNWLGLTGRQAFQKIGGPPDYERLS